ncbi:UNVERIFIED_CONTAM: hypothetical protein Sradi_4059500 [Sesamum radiatum]|uniref:Uncharacterized protein n=1 Tax=Sesamum radiatum TaxID=300843 RepID=A0AAW2PNM3_SESRA
MEGRAAARAGDWTTEQRRRSGACVVGDWWTELWPTAEQHWRRFRRRRGGGVAAMSAVKWRRTGGRNWSSDGGGT